MSRWNGIDEFVAVAAAGSFTKGAAALGLSTTHVSRAIMLLEQRLQTQLIHRTTRAVRLTETGRVFHDHCQRLLHDRDEAIALITKEGEPEGELRMTCSTALGERFVAPLMQRFALQHARLGVVMNLTNGLVDLVSEGYDLAIRTGALADARLIRTRIASRQFLTCAAPGYIDHAAPLLTVQDLDRHQHIIGTSATWKFKQGRQEVLYKPSGRFRCNSGHAVVNACITGMGVCQLPDFYVLGHIGNGALRPLLDEYRPDDEPIWAVYPQQRHLAPKVRGAIDHLRRELPLEIARSHDNPALVHGP
jgi:DNA-binding transcriptional LysR family regulator